ncbi:sensor histidine kinase [Halovenus sp. WSH3]|uniref:histidine kinase n=1 Tax=Halovenus carboxidivorans TaxID=2692199 RepID=A0A6B0TCL2_9EURY|nr:HAMP domain-containing sensor histidine kinase [Halovenus carboxidivorans]MXR53142.1 sensor histidine kinase [Halovenus carboxidivorans]
MRGRRLGGHWLLRLVIGLGVVLILSLLVEIGAIIALPLSMPDGYGTGFITSGLSALGLLYGGYWSQTGIISAERYRRLFGWCFGGAGLFLAINLGFILTIGPVTPFETWGWVRWAVSMGAAIGLALGLFEARAIERAIEAERNRMRRQEIKQERDHLEEFASIVSHDLRNPLNVASGRLALAREECDSDHLEEVSQSLDRMDELIDDLLTLARNGQAVQELEPVNVGTAAQHCWSTVQTENASSAISIDREVLADGSRFRQLLENLIRNAIEHGGADVTVTVGELEDGFYVEDTGPGIPEPDRESVFEAGYSTTEQGTGFGLSIVSEIVEAHDWEIRVTEGDDGGARFEIRDVSFATEEPGGHRENP